MSLNIFGLSREVVCPSLIAWDNATAKFFFFRNPDWIVYHELVMTTKEYLRDCCTIEPQWLTQLAPHLFKHVSLTQESALYYVCLGFGTTQCYVFCDVFFLKRKKKSFCFLAVVVIVKVVEKATSSRCMRQRFF